MGCYIHVTQFVLADIMLRKLSDDFRHYEWFESPYLYLIAVGALLHPRDICSFSRLCIKMKMVEGKTNSGDLFGMDSHCYQH
jgi:hypothetical protein